VLTQVGQTTGDVWNAGSDFVSDNTNWGGGGSNNNYNNQVATVYQPSQNTQTYSNNNYSNNSNYSNSNSNSSCNGTMSQSQYASFKSSGQISSSVSINGSVGYGYFSNNTDCYMPVSLAAFKMYDNSLATQVLYSSTGVSNVAPHSTLTLNVNLPNCKAQVDTYFGSAPSSPVNDGDINIAAAVTSANYCTNPNPTPTPNPTLYISCYANPSSVQTGNTINWYANASGGTGNYSYSWTGTDGLSGNSQNASMNYSNVGSKNANVTVISGTQSATANCSASVYQVQGYDNSNYNYNYNYNSNSGGYSYYYPYNYNYSYNNNSTLSGYCSAGVSNTSVGSTVTWTASPSGGNGFYTYYWYGDGGLSSNSQYAPITYNSPGVKNAVLTITSNGQSITSNCSVNVGQVLAYSQTNPLVSSVYLSQIPYTGAGDVLKVVLFATILALWSGIIAYVTLKRKEKQVEILATETAEETKALENSDKMTEARNSILSDHKAISDIEDYARLHKIIISQSAAAELLKLSRLGMANASEIIRGVAETKANKENEWTTLGEHDIAKHLGKSEDK
jgi:hypothetical protein